MNTTTVQTKTAFEKCSPESELQNFFIFWIFDE